MTQRYSTRLQQFTAGDNQRKYASGRHQRCSRNRRLDANPVKEGCFRPASFQQQRTERLPCQRSRGLSLVHQTDRSHSRCRHRECCSRWSIGSADRQNQHNPSRHSRQKTAGVLWTSLLQPGSEKSTPVSLILHSSTETIITACVINILNKLSKTKNVYKSAVDLKHKHSIHSLSKQQTHSEDHLSSRIVVKSF